MRAKKKKKNQMCIDETLKQSRVNVTIIGNAVEAYQEEETHMRLNLSTTSHIDQFKQSPLIGVILL